MSIPSTKLYRYSLLETADAKRMLARFDQPELLMTGRAGVGGALKASKLDAS